MIRRQHLLGKSDKGSGLTGNEADVAVAVSFFFSVVVTNEKPNKSGPLRVAAENDGKGLYLTTSDQSKFS